MEAYKERQRRAKRDGDIKRQRTVSQELPRRESQENST